MLHMARHKFASNVCEKALTTADPESRRLLIEEIMTPRQDGLSPILTMMKDQFASKTDASFVPVLELTDIIIHIVRLCSSTGALCGGGRAEGGFSSQG